MIKTDRLVNTFLQLVAIDSPSGHEAEIARVASRLLRELGGDVSFDTFGNLIAKFAGVGEPIMLSAHLDTVEPGRNIKPLIKKDKIISDGQTILGGDAKAGLAIILEAIASIQEDKSKHLPIEVVFTLSEEIGLVGAQNLDYKKITAKTGIVFDGENDMNNVDISAPGSVKVSATIIGKGAHAGVEPEKGISAIQISSTIITKLKLGRIDFETTANIGLITGGTAVNAVPEKVTIEGDIRSRNEKKLERMSNHFRKVFDETVAKYPGAKYELQLNRKYYSYTLTEDNNMIKRVKLGFEKLNLIPNIHGAGGATDANIFFQHGIQTVVLGIGDFEPHTTREYVVISQLVQAAELCQELVCV